MWRHVYVHRPYFLTVKDWVRFSLLKGGNSARVAGGSTIYEATRCGSAFIAESNEDPEPGGLVCSVSRLKWSSR